MSRQFLACSIVALLTLTCPSPAAADDPGVNPGGDAYNVTALEAVHATPTGVETSETIPARYVFVPVCDRGRGVSRDGFYGCGSTVSCGEQGTLYWQWRVTGQTSVIESEVCVDRGESIPMSVLTPALIRRAFERVPLPTSRLVVSPPGGQTLVNLRTITSTEADRFTRTLTLLGRRVTLDIRPVAYHWHYGDGSTRDTASPGRPYRAGTPMSR